MEARWTWDGPLTAVVNAYGDTQVTGRLPTDPAAFRAALHPIVAGAGRGVWLRVPYDAAHVALLPAAHELGFTAVHHAVDGFITLQAWCKPGGAPNPTPTFACTDIGAGAFVVNSRGQLLGIREKYDTSGLWHTPGGHVDAGEDVLTAGAREAWEETGVRASPLGVVGWRELLLPMAPPAGGPPLTSPEDWEKQVQNVRFGSTNLAGYVLCAALSDAPPVPDPSEIAEAAWLEPGDFADRAHETEAVYARCLASTGQLAAAAALARRLQQAGAVVAAGGDDVDVARVEEAARAALSSAGGGGAAAPPTSGAAAAAAATVPSSLVTEEEGIPHLTHGYAVTTAHRRWGAAAPYTAHWFTSVPPAVFLRHIAAAPSTLAVHRRGGVPPSLLPADVAAAKAGSGLAAASPLRAAAPATTASAHALPAATAAVAGLRPQVALAVGVVVGVCAGLLLGRRHAVAGRG
jgi:8-oxo-dGTP pyrophosphatase MutT (NUDIX family)